MIVTIKKYSNRRLYDTSESRYITQEELAERIRAGVEPRVIDAATGADLTQATLTQIVLERGAGRMLPTALLVQMIRMDDSALAEFLGYTMSWALQVFHQTRSGMQSLAGFAPMHPMQAFNPFAAMFGGGGSAPPPQGAGPGASTTPWGTTVPGPAAAPRPAPEPEPEPEPEPDADDADDGLERLTPPPPSGGPAAASSDEVAALRREMEMLKEVILGLGKRGPG